MSTTDNPASRKLSEPIETAIAALARQAFVLHRFLHLALRHGPGWFAESCLDLDAAVAAAKAKRPVGEAL